MIHLVTIDFWDTIVMIGPGWNSQLFTLALKVFLSCDSTITKARIAAAFSEEDKEFSLTLAETMTTIPIMNRLENLARYAHVKLKEQTGNELRELFDATILNPLPELVPDAFQLLSRLRKAKVPLCLISNTGWFSSQAITMALKHHNLIDFFDCLICSDEVGAAKPSTKIFGAALAAMSSRPDEAVHIGNKLETDVAGALNAGLYAIHFHPCGKCSRKEFWCASDFAEVWTILSGKLDLSAQGRCTL